ncbi:MAG: Hsp33 family molecular chaperone HslO, partial [Bacillota bacterium]|nr:Hsp33 family molecular chaperone HslO [Bacillota bacterium]
MKEAKAGQEGQGDYLVRGVAAEGSVLVMAAVATRLADEARWRHGTAPVATAALGRALTAAAMMGAALKRNERVLLQICGDGPLGKVVAEADASGRVRGYVSHPRVDLPATPEGKLDVGRGVGHRGTLYVIRDLGLKEPYIGSVPLVSGEIAKDLTYYFARSEQMPSSVALGALVETDGS